MEYFTRAILTILQLVDDERVVLVGHLWDNGELGLVLNLTNEFHCFG